MQMKDWYVAVLALVIWREARGEPIEGKIAVASVIKNRVEATHLPDKWDDVIEQKWQFSSLTAPGDAMLVQWPHDEDQSWLDSMQVAQQVFDGTIPDNTNGAVLYCNLKVAQPAWALPEKRTAIIGNHTFFKG